MAEFVTEEAQIIVISFIRNKSSVTQMTAQLIGAKRTSNKDLFKECLLGVCCPTVASTTDDMTSSDTSL